MLHSSVVKEEASSSQDIRGPLKHDTYKLHPALVIDNSVPNQCDTR